MKIYSYIDSRISLLNLLLTLFVVHIRCDAHYGPLYYRTSNKSLNKKGIFCLVVIHFCFLYQNISYYQYNILFSKSMHTNILIKLHLAVFFFQNTLI